jgi:hypothetical protein
MRRVIFTALVALFVVATVWVYAGAPSSVAEAEFLHRLHRDVDRERIDLSVLMPGHWEQVCGAHGYSGPFYLEKYNRRYPAAGASDDGAWGLVFIFSDGSFVPASGNCRLNGARLFVGGCVPRDTAAMTGKTESNGCRTFRR